MESLSNSKSIDCSTGTSSSSSIQDIKVSPKSSSQVSKEVKMLICKVLTSYLGKDNFNIKKIKKLASGLTNYLFLIIYQYKDGPDVKVFFKLFGTISSYHLVDRKFETELINVSSKENICSKCLSTDFTTYRLEEYLDNIHKPSDDILFTDEEFIHNMLNAVVKFNFSIYKMEKELYNKFSKPDGDYCVYSFLKKVVATGIEKYNKFDQEYAEWRENQNNINHEMNYTCKIICKENMNKIKYFLDNFEDVFSNLISFKSDNENLDARLMILNHCDVHKHNLLIKDNDYKNILLIDYEYACMNYIGFDIINYCIESFFDLEYPEYPFYQKKVDDVGVLFEDEKYFSLYIKYIDKLVDEMKSLNKNKESDTRIKFKVIPFCEAEFKDFEERIIPIMKRKRYFARISGLCSLFWFYSSLISLDFKSSIYKQNFNYLDYSIDRLSIYEKSLNYFKLD